MSHTSNSVNDQFRLKVAQLDKARRQLVHQAFSSYSGDTTELTLLLISEAKPETLAKLEAFLSREAQG